MAEAYAQVAPDSTGKRISNVAITLPLGAAVTDGDGNVTYLAAATTVFIQRIAVSDSAGNIIDDFTGNDRQGEIIAELRELRRVICEVHNQIFIDQPDE